MFCYYDSIVFSEVLLCLCYHDSYVSVMKFCVNMYPTTSRTLSSFSVILQSLYGFFVFFFVCMILRLPADST